MLVTLLAVASRSVMKSQKPSLTTKLISSCLPTLSRHKYRLSPSPLRKFNQDGFSKRTVSLPYLPLLVYSNMLPKHVIAGQEMVGNYNASFYSINGMVLETRKRREHLSKDDVQKNKALLENFATGNTSYLEDQQNGWVF